MRKQKKPWQKQKGSAVRDYTLSSSFVWKQQTKSNIYKVERKRIDAGDTFRQISHNFLAWLLCLFSFCPFLFHIFFCLVSLASWPIFSPLILFFSFLFCPGNQCLQPAFLIEVTFQCSCVLWSSCSIHNRLHPLLSAFDCLAFPLTDKASETNCLSSL